MLPVKVIKTSIIAKIPDEHLLFLFIIFIVIIVYSALQK